MNEHDENPNSRRQAGAQDSVADAIRLAGRREMPPAADREQIFAAAAASLQQKRAEQRHSRNRRVGMAAAAVIVLVIGGSLLLQPELTDSPVTQAQVDRLAGELEWLQSGATAWQPVRENDRLPGNGRLRTNNGSRAGVVLASGISVRLAAATTISLTSASTLRLDSGKIYVDAGPDRSTSIEVITPAGIARDIGTQFEVRYIEPEFRLRIREGSVSFARAETQLLANAGDEVTVDLQGAIRQRPIAADDQDWLWAEELAPVPELDGEPLTALLEWVRRETGRPVIFASEAVKTQVSATVLHGSITNMSPLDTLGAMLSTTDFRYRLEEDGTILIYAER